MHKTFPPFSQITLGDFSIWATKPESAEAIYQEIFEQNEYDIALDTDSPVIIDCGSNIGLSVLYFKKRYPNAKILAFEPDPVAFFLLKKNIELNNIHDVNLINAALSHEEGETNLYGQFFTDNADSRGNSILSDWGIQRQLYEEIHVKSVKLSSYINNPINLLKLDIEGAEEKVLTELAGKLNTIEHIIAEIHTSPTIDKNNNLERIIALLKQEHFSVSFVEKEVSSILPKEIQSWTEKTKPRLYQLHAKNLETCTSV